MFSTGKLKSVDFYRKIPRDLTEASLSGAGLSIIAALAIVFLFEMLSCSLCEFASVDVSDVLGTNRLNITKTIRKVPIDANLKPTAAEFHSGPDSNFIEHGDDVEEESGEGSVILTAKNFDAYSHQYPVLVVNFYATWCYWSNRLKPSWEKVAKIIRERYDPEMDGRIILGKVNCTLEGVLCRKDDHGHHDHESYYE